MWIAKNDNIIILARDAREELEQALGRMTYTSIEETNINYQLYNCKYLTPEEIAILEQERIAKLSLTKREVLLALYDDKGVTPEQIKAQLNERGKIEFDYANEYFRGNPLIDALGLALGYTSEQLDYLFEHKEFPQNED